MVYKPTYNWGAHPVRDLHRAMELVSWVWVNTYRYILVG